MISRLLGHPVADDVAKVLSARLTGNFGIIVLMEKHFKPGRSLHPFTLAPSIQSTNFPSCLSVEYFLGIYRRLYPLAVLVAEDELISFSLTLTVLEAVADAVPEISVAAAKVFILRVCCYSQCCLFLLLLLAAYVFCCFSLLLSRRHLYNFNYHTSSYLPFTLCH